MQEPLPEPTAAELAKEAEQEAAVFAQAANVDRLLQMLRQMDPAKDNLADNEEIQVRVIFLVSRATSDSVSGIIQVVHECAAQDSEAY